MNTMSDTPGDNGAILSRRYPRGTSRIDFIQIEITTICTFDCFYCAGRIMPQRHMAPELFENILKHLPARRLTVSLQGEGEPTLHPYFWDMAERVAGAGKIPYTITNCSAIDTEAAARLFPRIGVSLDTIDADEADRIGRFDLRGVLANLERLVSGMGSRRIIVHSVDFGQPLDALRRYLRTLGIHRHIVQSIQVKDDYRKRYPLLVEQRDARYHFRCRYVFRPFMRYFDINGTMMPCCSIKDARGSVSVERIRESLSRGVVPECCRGCREICGGSR